MRNCRPAGPAELDVTPMDLNRGLSVMNTRSWKTRLAISLPPPVHNTWKNGFVPPRNSFEVFYYLLAYRWPANLLLRLRAASLFGLPPLHWRYRRVAAMGATDPETVSPHRQHSARGAIVAIRQATFPAVPPISPLPAVLATERRTAPDAAVATSQAAAHPRGPLPARRPSRCSRRGRR